MPRLPISTLLLCFAWFGCQALASKVSDAAELEGALAADDVCTEGDTEGKCSLELRLLRTQELKMRAKRAAAADGAADGTVDAGGEEQAAGDAARESLEEQASSSFGPDAVGVDMWTEATWGDMVAMLQSNASAEGEADYYPGYGPHGGHPGHGGHMHGHSVCAAATGGTCGIFGCSQSRGATRCADGKCLCEHGFCAMSGFCYPTSAASCMADTGGSCSVTSCRSSRGKTKCKHGHCLCKTGGCAWKGKCFPVTDTGGSCSLMGCSSSRGPTTCHRGRCLCRAGFVAVSGRCEHYL